METITLQRHITDKKVKTLDEFDCEKVVLKKFYDLHGQHISEGQETFTNCHVKLNLITYKEFGQKWQQYQVFIDGKELDEVEVVDLKGSTKFLTIRGCTGAG